MVADADVDDFRGFLKSNAFTLFRVEVGSSETAEVAVGVADVGYCELEVTGTAVIQNFADKFKEAFFGARS